MSRGGAFFRRSTQKGVPRGASVQYLIVFGYDGSMLSDDGRAGNATMGLFDTRELYKEFLTTYWLEIMLNYNVWVVASGGRVVNK